jgi:hypothetical protein
MTDTCIGTPTAEHLTVPFDMVHGSGNYALRLSNDAPAWQMMAGDYLIIRPLAPDADPPCCSLVIVREDSGERLSVWHRTGFSHVRLTHGDGSYTFHNGEDVQVCGVLAGIIRKY